jgi:aminocarboxymuconate-semialdehyde decarboxylase
MPVIDIHTHFVPQNWPDLADRFGTPGWPSIRHHETDHASLMLGDLEFRQIRSACWDAQKRLEDMDRTGVGMQVISATPVLFGYERPAEHALECARIFNDAALEICSHGQGRLRTLCQVPLQDTDFACGELSRAMRSGHVGVQIGNHVGERNLDDAGIVTFLNHCAAEGAAVLVHPWDMMAPERMSRYMTPWTVGMPAETHLGIVSLILSGAFDKIARNLKICFAHGGGSFVYVLGRLENAWRHHETARGKSHLPPRDYLDRFFVDSAVFDPQALRFLIDAMGTDRVMLGSDYPFPLGEAQAGELVRHSDLPAAMKTAILGENAARFFDLLDEKQQPSGLVQDLAGKLTYSSYLRVPELLSLQRPQSSPEHHDELLFITIHQTYELWFKQILHELDAVIAALRGQQVYEAARLLRRCTEIMRVLVEQFTILETMLPTHFLAFRGALKPASGFQSEQFREIEFLCGLKDVKMLRYHEPTLAAYVSLERRLKEPSLHDVLFEAISGLHQGSALPDFAARAQAIRALYADESHYRDWIDVCERLTEFDELTVSWRLRHIQMVERTIGVRLGTGGSSGASYLKHTLDKKFFPELWEARTMLAE